jgi:signal transduction histidine kinase
MLVARVLHIEDDATSRLLVRTLLSAAGHEVVEASTGIEGVRVAGEMRPDLVLLDINLPGLDGYEVTLRLRSMDGMRGVPIVAITADGDRQTSLAVGADGFLTKPIDAAGFARTLGEFLGGRRERGEVDARERRLRDRAEKIVERLEAKIDELERANARLEELARLRREFLRNTSHELATPLTPIVGYLRMLVDGRLGPVSEEQQRALLAVRDCVHRLRGTIETLLDVSAMESERMHFDRRAYDLGLLAARAVSDARASADEAGLVLVMASPPGASPGRGDPDKLRRALFHLLTNAVKFTPAGGRVAVEVADGPRPGEHRVVVADTGPGIEAAHRERIFEPFYQVDGSVTRPHGGAGLGLTYVQRVAAAHGGRVEVESPPARPVAGERLTGSLFALVLPREPSPEARARDAPRASVAAARPRRRR